jgi:hypothetical protein
MAGKAGGSRLELHPPGIIPWRMGRERRRTAVEAQLCKLEAGVAESFPAVVIHPIGGMPVGLVAGSMGEVGRLERRSSLSKDAEAQLQEPCTARTPPEHPVRGDERGLG